jgi:hypothetical protein
MAFHHLKTDIQQRQLQHVDVRQWRADWADRWVAYSDLLGFAQACDKSADKVVNLLARFHRSINDIFARLKAPDLRIYQFTDAVFVVSPTPVLVLQFTAMLHHWCLGMNSLMMETERLLLANHMLNVRTTIARGQVLQLPPRPLPDSRLIGISAESIVAGAGIVQAYRLEKRTGGMLISMLPGDRAALTDLRLASASSPKPSAPLLQNWLQESPPTQFAHDGVVDFPWLLLRPDSTGTALETDTIDSIRDKLLTLHRMAELLLHEYITEKIALDTIKHYGALHRHMIELVQRLRGLKRNRRWTIADAYKQMEALRPEPSARSRRRPRRARQAAPTT